MNFQPIVIIGLRYLVLCFFPLLAMAAASETLEIRGVSGKILGNVEKRLHELQQLKPLSSFSTDELTDQVTQALQPYGYFKAAATIQEIKSHTLLITITPGAQVRVISVQKKLAGEGRQNPQLIRALNEFPLQPGDPLFTDTYNKAKHNLSNLAESLGYLHAHFSKTDILVNPSTNSAAVDLVFDTGPMYYFGQIEFDPTYIKPELLHRYVPFKPGQFYSTEQVLQLNDALSGSGYFNSVVVKPAISETSNTVPVAVHLQPVPRYSYSLSAGYGTDTGVRGRAALHVIPVNRSGHKFNALAQGSFNQNALQAQYLVPGKHPATDQYSFTGNYSNLNYSSGYSNALLLSAGQQHNTKHLQRALSINGLYESFHYTLQPSHSEFMLYPKATFTLTKADSPLFSPSGYSITFNALGANQWTLSNLNFGQLSVNAKAAIRIDPLRLRIYGHTIQGITETSNINQLPLSLALLLGGTDTMKAFSFNSIGPGKIISYGGLELQKETLKNWYLTGFYDAGDVYNPTPKNFQYDIGGGLMWVSPIGPIKAGLAQSIDRNWHRVGTNPRLVISMGSDL